MTVPSVTDRLVQALIACTLPKAGGTRHAHLRVGLWHLRERIRRYADVCPLFTIPGCHPPA